MMMKRKRSDSDMSSSGSSIFPSSPLSNHMDMTWSSPFQHARMSRDIIPIHLSSRTRKRHRDNRPSEDQVHQHTLSILYSAQQNSQLSPIPSQAPISSSHRSDPTQQASLHSFWALPNRPSSSNSSHAAFTTPAPNLSYRATNCEDCDTQLVSADGDSMDMDIDLMIHGDSLDHGCSTCGKQVCHQCAISNLGEQRQCLTCAGRKQWIGGLGWVTQ